LKKFIIFLSWLPFVLNSQPVRFQLLPLSFAPGKAVIGETDFPIFDSLASFLRKTGAQIEVGGHTDNLGTQAQNEELSRLRAQAICDYLKTKHKIPPGQLVAKGYGPSQPIATNRTPAGRVKNNRIEITVLSEIPSVLLANMRGGVRIQKVGMTDWSEVKKDQTVSISDRFETDSTGGCFLVLDNGGKVGMRSGSELAIEEITRPIGKTAAVVKLWSDGGKFQVDNYPAGDNRIQLIIGTAVLQLTSDASNFLYEVQPYTQDLISVGRGKVIVQDRVEGPAMEVGDGYGTRCRIGKSPDAPSALPPPPVFKSVSGKDTLFLEPGKPLSFVFYFTKPATAATRVILSRDKDRNETVLDVVTPDDSLLYEGTGIDVLYATLSSVEASGLESPRTPARLICLTRKTTGPKLVITRQSVEIKGDKKVLLIEGKTEPLSELSVNDEKIKIPDDGTFSMMIRLGPGTSRVTLKSTSRWGHTSILVINLKTGYRYEAALFTGPTYLSGSGFNTSRIGLLSCVYFSFPLREKLSLAPFIGLGEIRCRRTNWEPAGDHYKTTINLGGFRLKYLLTPAADIVFSAGIEAGMIYWKSYYDGEVEVLSINPLGGLFVGAKINLSDRIGLVLEAAAAYFRNKDKYNLGRQGIKYILPQGCLGLAFNF